MTTLLSKKQVRARVGFSFAHITRMETEPEYAHLCFPRRVAAPVIAIQCLRSPGYRFTCLTTAKQRLMMLHLIDHGKLTSEL